MELDSSSKLLANILEKDILAGNLNSGLSYLITTVTFLNFGFSISLIGMMQRRNESLFRPSFNIPIRIPKKDSTIV